MPKLSIWTFPAPSYGQSNGSKFLVESSVFWHLSLEFWLNDTIKLMPNKCLGQDWSTSKLRIEKEEEDV